MDKKKQIIFFVNKPKCGYPADIFADYARTKRAIEQGDRGIQTTQMCFLSTSLFLKGYRVFLFQTGKMSEIRLGESINGSRPVKMEHNLFHLFEAGEFSHSISKDKETK